MLLVQVVSQQRHERELPESGSPVLSGSVHNVVCGPKKFMFNDIKARKGRSIYYVRREGEGGVENLDQNANAVREVA